MKIKYLKTLLIITIILALINVGLGIFSFSQRRKMEIAPKSEKITLQGIITKMEADKIYLTSDKKEVLVRVLPSTKMALKIFAQGNSEPNQVITIYADELAERIKSDNQTIITAVKSKNEYQAQELYLISVYQVPENQEAIANPHPVRIPVQPSF